jgi:hypothetical protein
VILEEVKLIAAGVALLAVTAGVIWIVKDLEAVGAAKSERARAEERAAAEAQVAATRKEDAVISARRAQNLTEAVHDATVQSDDLRVRLAASDRSRDSFRMQLDAYVRHARAANPAASAGSAPVDGGDAAGVLAGLLDRSAARAIVYAGIAEKRRIRAELCERGYQGNAVTQPAPDQ